MISLTVPSCDAISLMFSMKRSMKLRSRLGWEPVSIVSQVGEGWRRIRQFMGGYYSMPPLRGFLPTLFCIQSVLLRNVNRRLSGNWIVGTT
jgi:hypothetical protein